MEAFTSIKPKNKILEKYIDTFYFHHSDEEGQFKRIIFFPNTKNALTIYKNGTLRYENQLHLKIDNNSSNGFGVFFGGIQKTHIISDIEGSFQKIGIIFKPTGINYFLQENLKKLILKNKFEFNHFNETLFPVLTTVYAETDFERKAILLENFFLEHLKEKEELKIIELGIEIIENSNDKVKIADVAKRLCVSSKTLNRKFQTHLNCSPKHYSKVVVFRKAILKYKRDQANLTAIALDNWYFDQSDFIKNFKKLAGKNPSAILKHIKDLGNNIFWIK